MALLYLKRVLFINKKRKHEYSALSSPSFEDLECQRCPSQASTLAGDNAATAWTEKPTISSQACSSSTLDVSSTTTTSSTIFSARTISDATLGLSDGLTVPFALTAGLSHFNSSRIVIYGGLAELLAGSISMGLGGYLGAKSEAESARNSRREVEETVRVNPERTREMMHACLSESELDEGLLDAVITKLMEKKRRAAGFLMKMRGETQEEEWDGKRAYVSAVTIGVSYFVGGFIPLVPYFLVDAILHALYVSIAIMAVALLVFGYFKTSLVGEKRIWRNLVGAGQMLLLGGIAAAVSVGFVKLGSVLEGGGGGAG
ncbi:MAG: hypothetical protein Q9162_004080 [Coniocarpon cinnabarinum]